MKRFKSILCASLITFALSSSALAGNISIGKATAGNISIGKATAGNISIGRSTVNAGDVTIGQSASVDGYTYLDFAGYLLMLLSTMRM